MQTYGWLRILCFVSRSLPTARAILSGLSTNRQLGATAQAAELARVLLGDGHDDVLPLAVDARDHKLGKFRQNGERFICRDMFIDVDLIPSDIRIVDLWNCGRCSLGDGRSARCSLRLVCGSR